MGVGSGYWLGLQERGIVGLVCQGGAITDRLPFSFFRGGGGWGGAKRSSWLGLEGETFSWACLSRKGNY